VTKYIYVPVANYDIKVTKGFYKGEQIGRSQFIKWLNWVRNTEPEIKSLTDFNNESIICCNENIDQFSIPFFRRQMGRKLLDVMTKGDELVFYTARWSGSDAKDLSKILSLCNSRHVVCIFLREKEGWLEFDFELSDFCDLSLNGQNFLTILEDIGEATRNFRRLKSQITHYHSKQRKNLRGHPPLGFTKNKQNILIPDWDAQLLLRLIAYLRDRQELGWAAISHRLAELYSKEGRHYPTASKAKIPWSPQMCIKGYKAWKEIERESIVLRSRCGNDAHTRTVLD